MIVTQQTQPNNRGMRKKDFERQCFLAAHPVGSYYITGNEDESTADKMSEKWGGFWKQVIDRGIVAAGGKFSAGSLFGNSDWRVPYHNHVLTNGNHNHAWLSGYKIPFSSSRPYGNNVYAFAQGNYMYSSANGSNLSWDDPMNIGIEAQYAGLASDTLIDQNYALSVGAYMYMRVAVPFVLPLDGLLAEYTFDDVSNNVVRDTSGNGFDLIATWNFSLMNSRLGKGRVYDSGINAVMNFGNPSWIQEIYNAPYTISVATVHDGEKMCLTIGGGTVWAASVRRIYLEWVSAESKVIFWTGRLTLAVGDYRLAYVSDVPVAHVAMTSTGEGQYSAYVNGVYVGEVPLITTAESLPIAPSKLGVTLDVNNYQQGLAGCDQIRVYNRALEEVEIEQLASEVLGGLSYGN